jgi:1-pyrroline-5-carboxylate dehydrogenase
VQSAFGFQGQKCSACSRAIIDARLRSNAWRRLRAHGEDQVAIRHDPATNMSAVINEKAFKTINAYIEKGKSEGGSVLPAAVQMASRASLSSQP